MRLHILHAQMCRCCHSNAQTSTLVNALSETSVYQSARFSRAARGRHVLVTGHLSAATCSLITKELFHQDSGYSDFTLVFLSPAAPNDVMRRLLKTSRHSHRLLYIQGSWAVHEVCDCARFPAKHRASLAGNSDHSVLHAVATTARWLWQRAHTGPDARCRGCV
jgi:hypothetical protein